MQALRCGRAYLFVIFLFLTGTLSTAQTPTISSGGVVNGASGRAGIASGSWVTIYGTNLSTTTRQWNAADFRDGRLPMSLDGVSVKINNRDAAVYFISPTQINALAPTDPSLGIVGVTVTNSRGTSANFATSYQTYSPAFFTFSQQNGIYPAAVYPSGAFVGRTDLFAGAASSLPPAPGDRILLFGTGFGPVTPAADPASVVTGAATLATGNDLTISVGGQRATVEFAGLVGSGLYQFNIIVPDVPDGDQPLIAQIGGLTSQATLRLTVRRRGPPAISFVGVGLTPEAARNDCPGVAACLTSSVTASPGQQLEYWILGNSLANATGVRLVPPEGVTTSILETSATSMRVLSVIAPDAREGTRQLVVTSPDGDSSNSSRYTVRISTFRMSNLRVSDVTIVNSQLRLRLTMDYADPTGAASSGPLTGTLQLAYPDGRSGGCLSTRDDWNPEGRVPGATSGTMTLPYSCNLFSGTTGIFSVNFIKDGRPADGLRVRF